jgi:hypothetical protein
MMKFKRDENRGIHSQHFITLAHFKTRYYEGCAVSATCDGVSRLYQKMPGMIYRSATFHFGSMRIARTKPYLLIPIIGNWYMKGLIALTVHKNLPFGFESGGFGIPIFSDFHE